MTKESSPATSSEEILECAKSWANNSSSFGDSLIASMLAREVLRLNAVASETAKHAVTQQMYDAGMKYLHGRGTAWCCTDLYLAMEDARIAANRQNKAAREGG